VTSPPRNDEQRRQALSRAVAGGSRPLGLVKACIEIARGEYPRLDGEPILREVRRIGAAVQKARLATPHARNVDVLARVITGVEGFTGDVEDYENPANSYVNCVLERRRGLPILLAILWIEVGRLAGIRVEGMPLPGHFLVVVQEQEEVTYADPFRGGRVLGESEMLSLWVGPGGEAPASGNPFARANSRRILLRVLGNLVQSYERRRDPRRMERVLWDQVELNPADPVLLARRGEARALSGDRPGALTDLNAAIPRMKPGPHFARAHETARLLARTRLQQN
jgi:regulator of sirC expression with transglutaminase-like and TPR domain